MGLLDGPMRGVAKTLLGILGGSATLSKETRDYEPSTDTNLTTTQQITIQHSPPEPYAAYRIDGTLVQAGDAKVLVAAQDLEDADFSLPAGSHQNVYMTIDGRRWTVVRVNEVRSGDLPAALELQLRR